jgi:hypothetical protein
MKVSSTSNITFVTLLMKKLKQRLRKNARLSLKPGSLEKKKLLVARTIKPRARKKPLKHLQRELREARMLPLMALSARSLSTISPLLSVQ